ncbi:hypothetical protein K1T71_014863 [Dendrolimus kikuchii]|nr:hypothetical protein K1T71_014863 [Dendrolimus kikuchii]
MHLVQGDVQLFLEGLKFSPECITELSTLLCTDQMYVNIPKHLKMKPGIASLAWRIDVSLSQTNITSENPSDQRKKEILYHNTYVILILELTDGQTQTFRLSIPKFQELRFVIANALKTMIVLEKRKCMRKE